MGGPRGEGHALIIVVGKNTQQVTSIPTGPDGRSHGWQSATSLPDWHCIRRGG